MIRKILITILISTLSFSATNHYNYFLNNRGTTLQDIINAVVKDQEEAKQRTGEAEKIKSFQSSGGGSTFYRFSNEDYQEKNRLTIFPDIKMVHRELPGVADGGDFDAALFFRGGNAYETVTLVNGQPVYEAFVFDGKGSLVNPQLVEETNIYTSGIPVSYPDVLSGVVNITERVGNRDEYKLEMSQSLTDMQIVAEGPIQKGVSSFLVSARRTYYDYLLQSMEQGSGRIAPHLENYGQKFFLKFSPKHEAVVDFKTYYDFYKLENKDFNLGSTGQHSFVSRRNFLQTKFTSYWNDNMKTEVVVGMENTVLSKNIMVGTTNASEKMRQEPFYLKADYQYRESDSHLFATGIYYRQEKNIKKAENMQLLGNYIFPGFSSYVDSENYSIEYPVYGVYVQDEQELLPDKVFMDVGVRYSFIDHDLLSNSKSLQPRVGLKIKDGDTTFKFSVGKYSQFNPKTVSSNFQNLFPEEALQYSVGLDHLIGSDTELSFGLFQKKYTSLVREIVDSGGIITSYDNNKTGQAKGLEIFWKKRKSDGWKALASYTNQDVSYVDSVRGEYPAKHDQKHTFSFSGEVDIVNDLSIVLDWQFHTGRPYTDLTGATTSNMRSAYLENPAKYNKSRLPDYSNLTIILEYKKPIWPFSEFEGQSYIGVANVLNADNIYDYVWNSDYSIQTSVKMLPMTPIFGVRVKF